MKRLYRTLRWLAPASTLWALGGCFSSAQLQDFARVEIARISADIVGRLITLFQAGT